MNAVAETTHLAETDIGLHNKFKVTRADGEDQPGGKHEGDEYFVLNLTTDKFALLALATYAESCVDENPNLASDLRTKLAAKATHRSIFIPVPAVTLSNGITVPSFQVGMYPSSRGPGGIAQVTDNGTPWVEIDYQESKAAASAAGASLITETQWLAIAHDIAQQDINWTGGKVGVGAIFQGLHKGTVDEAQPGTFESRDPDERCWHQLSNGEHIYHFVGNVYSWVHDDVQGDENGIVARAFAADSPSITTAPAPSMKKAWAGIRMLVTIGPAMRSSGAASGSPPTVPARSVSTASRPSTATACSASAAPSLARVSSPWSRVTAQR